MKTKTKLILALSTALAFSSCAQFFSSFASMVIRAVAFEENGGSAVADRKTSLISTMPVSSKSGYALEGWYTDATFAAGAKVSFPYDPLADQTLYAHWIQASPGLNYIANESGYTAWWESAAGAVVIPAYWLGKPVTAIGAWTFSGVAGITSVVIPETVSAIGSGAFYPCANLQNVETKALEPPAGYDNMFSGCASLVAVTVPSSSLAAYQAAAGWQSYASKMTTSDLSFSNYTVSFSANGGTAVASQTTTLIANIPASSKVGNALEGWYTDSNLAEGSKVSFPYDPLADVSLYAKWIPATEGLSYSANATGYSVSDSSAEGAVVIPAYWLGKPVTSIESWGFSYINLTSITIPVSVTEIGSSAFKACTGLTTLAIPSEVTSIGVNAFRSSSLTSITIPSRVGYIGNAAFYGCVGLTSVRADPVAPPTTYTDLFGSCAALTEIKVPASSVAAYQAAFGWSAYSAKISALP
jgi:uncharacterized repeat protein (TIGR02543 family)